MKYLSEMLDILGEDITQTQVTDKRYTGQFNWKKAGQATRDQLGDGAFSRVRPDHRDPHMVNKETRKPLGGQTGREDGFGPFIRYLVKHGHMDNIHFPKVYKANRTTDRNNEHKDSFQIERLEDPRKLSKEEIAFLIEANFTDRMYEHSVEEMASVLERSVTSDMILEKYVGSDTLKEAIHIVRAAKKELGFQLDLHQENIMVRRTSTGLQLVISDPFGYSNNPVPNKKPNMPQPKFADAEDISPSDVAALMK